jgi:hypothetical protein
MPGAKAPGTTGYSHSERTRKSISRSINDKHAIARFEAHITEIICTAIRQTPIPFSNILYEHDGQDT